MEVRDIEAEVKGDRKVSMPINGVEARALEAAADMLIDGRDMAGQRRRRVAGQLLRLNARWRLRDRVT